MAVSPKWNAILQPYFHYFKAHTLPFSAKFHHRPQHVAQNSAICKTMTQHVSLRKGRMSIKVSRSCLIHGPVKQHCLWRTSVPHLSHTVQWEPY